jgi:hypothetical protein
VENRSTTRGNGSQWRWESDLPLGQRDAAARAPGTRRATRRRGIGLALAVSGSLALAATAVVPASAAVPIAPRPVPAPPPTDRALEMVSPVDKGGQPIDHVLQIAEDGDGGVLFQSLGAFGDVQNNNAATFYRARRGATGWETTGLQPRPIDTIPSSRTTPTFAAADTQLESLIATSAYPFVPEAVRPGVTVTNVYRYGVDGAVDWLSRSAFAPSGVLGYAHVGAVSPDGRRVLLLGLASGSNAARLYVRDDDRTVEVGIGPDETPLSGSLPAGNVGGLAVRAPMAMSADGQTVAFNPTGASGVATSALYLRRDALGPNARTVVVNRSRVTGAPAGSTCGSGRFFGMTADGGRILLGCNGPLTDDAPASGAGVYGYDVATDALEYLGAVPSLMTELDIDRDLRRLYFRTTNAGLQDLLVLEDGQVREVAKDVGTIAVGNGSAEMSPDGERLAFISDRAIDGHSGRQMYVYDATDGPDGTLTCVSCRPGASEGGTASFGTRDVASPGTAGNARVESFSDDGRFYFMSTAALTPEAPEGPASVYEYHEGRVRLMVAGAVEAEATADTPARYADARFVGVSPDGTDVFVLTRQSLLPQDDDRPVPDLYSLRRGGGFPPDPVCSDCEPPAPPDLGGPRPGPSLGSTLLVPPTHGARPLPVTPRPRIVSRTARGTAARIRVRVNEAGALRVTGNGLRRVSRSVSRAGTYTLTVRLTAHGRRTLDRRGRITVRPRVRFAPKQGAAASTRTTLTIKRTRKAS